MTLQTKIGVHTGEGYRFRGHDVREWKGESSWSMLSIALGGRAITPQDSKILDDVFIAIIAPDPRIWPAKISRLVASFGDPFAGLSAALNLMNQGMGGPGHTKNASHLLLDAARAQEQGRFDEYIDALATGHEGVFSVLYRSADERHVLLKKWLHDSPTTNSKFFKLMLDVENAVAQKVPLRSANVTLSLAAVLLDVGVAPEHTGDFALLGVIPQLFAHCAEAATEKSILYRKLEVRSLRYEGKPARNSSRSHR